MNEYHQGKLREMLAKKRAMDAAWDAWMKAKFDYTTAQDSFLGCYPECSPPGPIICGTAFIKIKNGYRRADEEIKFEYVEAERCPTSE